MPGSGPMARRMNQVKTKDLGPKIGKFFCLLCSVNVYHSVRAVTFLASQNRCTPLIPQQAPIATGRSVQTSRIGSLDATSKPSRSRTGLPWVAKTARAHVTHATHAIFYTTKIQTPRRASQRKAKAINTFFRAN